MNPYDGHALGAANILRAHFGGEIIALTMGPPSAREVLRSACAAGAGRGVLLTDAAFAGADVYATAYTLARGIEKLTADGAPFIVVCGQQTTDGDTAQTPFSLARQLKIPAFGWVKAIEVRDGTLYLRQELSGVTAEAEARAPMLLAAGPRAAAPVTPTLTARLRAGKAELTEWALSDMPDTDAAHYGLSASPTRVKRIYAPARHKKSEPITEPPAETARRILSLIKHPNTPTEEEKEAQTANGGIHADGENETVANGGIRADGTAADGVIHAGGAAADEVINADGTAADGVINADGTIEPQTANGGILVYLQVSPDGKALAPVSLQLTAAARRLAGEAGGARVCGAVICGALTPPLAAALRACSLSDIYVYSGGEYAVFDVGTYAAALGDCVRLCKPDAVLVGGTPEGRATAPAAAADFATGVTADCTALAFNGAGELLQTRPAFGGGVMADIVTPRARPQIATVRAGAFGLPKSAASVSQPPAKLIHRALPPSAPYVPLRKRLTETEDNAAGEEEQNVGDVVLAVGGGVRRQEDLAAFAALARRLGAAFMCSRELVERGWCPQSRQIGLSGRSIEPRLLIACGVSGSVQFLSGVSPSTVILALNPDPKAPIMTTAALPITCNMYDILDRL
jgi:electron transfer flavoprotein alpha subunit